LTIRKIPTFLVLQLNVLSFKTEGGPISRDNVSVHCPTAVHLYTLNTVVLNPNTLTPALTNC